ncbi:MAG: LLM class flavin-dependent oxidoreductase [Gammaproteobacteria bacterium]|nr:LLM class flavin-dependent oxidoreductase [Gammaproteobacteria bacterium]
MAILSILDLSPIVEGGGPGESLNNSRDIARHAEQWGYHRYWVAEHHNMPGIASAATSVVIGHIAGGTNTIRVGAGGIMLPNHAPLVIAEQFGTLAALYPGRIDLGLGRAPGSDQRTAYALRRTLSGDVNDFPRDVVELREYFADASRNQIRAVPGAGEDVPIWILGSSLYGAQLAAVLGMPYAFASHFAPDALMQALDIYRKEFRPSEHLEAPYAMAGFNVFAADTEAEGHLLRTSARKSTLSMRTGHPRALPPPDPDFEANLSVHEKAMLDAQGACSAVGSPSSVRAQLRKFVDATGVDELMIAAQIYDHKARLRSFEIAMDVWKEETTADREQALAV